MILLKHIKMVGPSFSAILKWFLLILFNRLTLQQPERRFRSSPSTVLIKGRKEMFLFNDALNTFYLRLCGVGHMVKYHSDSERKPSAATWATLSD